MAGYEYPEAGGSKAQPEVKKAVERWRSLPEEERARIPLLYWLLGSGTPPYKMDKADAEYQEGPKGKQKCGNCLFAYQNATNGRFICSQVRGHIEPRAWCRLWKKGKEK